MNTTVRLRKEEPLKFPCLMEKTVEDGKTIWIALFLDSKYRVILNRIDTKTGISEIFEPFLISDEKEGAKGWERSDKIVTLSN
jgi:hypothetical protein